MKRILVVSDGWAAPLYGPRMRFLCDYLTKNGWSVRLCVEYVGDLPVEHSYPIDEIMLYRHKGVWGMLEWCLKSFLSLFFDYKNRVFARKIKRLYQNEHFDLVCCSAFHTFPLRAAYELAACKHIPLHFDVRDVAEQAPGHQYQQRNNPLLSLFLPLFRQINIRRRNKMIALGHSVSTVSPWHVSFLSQFNANVRLIYNGFDADVFQPLDVANERFAMVYAGKIYGQTMQNPTLLFEAVRQLQLDNFRLEFYTDASGRQRMRRLAEQYNVAHLVAYYDYVPNAEVPLLLQRSSIVLVFSNKECAGGPHGIMTTKFFEALGVEKPVLCVRSDEACLADVIRQTNAGLAATNVEEAKQFILEKYAEWQQFGYTHQPVNQAEKAKFSRQTQARQFDELFLKLL